jgi:hypothetical protein
LLKKYRKNKTIFHNKQTSSVTFCAKRKKNARTVKQDVQGKNALTAVPVPHRNTPPSQCGNVTINYEL